MWYSVTIILTFSTDGYVQRFRSKTENILCAYKSSSMPHTSLANNIELVQVTYKEKISLTPVDTVTLIQT